MAPKMLAQVLVSQAAGDMLSEGQIDAVVSQLVEHAERRALPPGVCYLTEFSLGPHGFSAGIRHNAETDKYDAFIGLPGEEHPFAHLGDYRDEAEGEDEEDEDAGDRVVPFTQFVQERPDVLRDHPLYPGMKLRLERQPPYRLQVLQGDKVEQEVALRSLGLLDVLRSMLHYDDLYPTSKLPRSPEIDAAAGNVKDAGGFMDGTDKGWIVWQGSLKEAADMAIEDLCDYCFERGQRLDQAGDDRGAITWYTAAIENEDEFSDPPIEEFRAAAYYRCGEVRKAIEDYILAITVLGDDDSTPDRDSLPEEGYESDELDEANQFKDEGDLLWDRGEYVTAFAAYKEAVIIDPSLTKAIMEKMRLSLR